MFEIISDKNYHWIHINGISRASIATQKRLDEIGFKGKANSIEKIEQWVVELSNTNIADLYEELDSIVTRSTNDIKRLMNLSNQIEKIKNTAEKKVWGKIQH